jgi:flavin-dependent dehydrogenase
MSQTYPRVQASPQPPTTSHDAPSLGPYDVVVVGGGAAGLCAARSAAALGLKTLLVERDQPPELSSVSRFGATERARDGGQLYLAELELPVPAALVTAYAVTERCLSPRGHNLRTVLDWTCDSVATVNQAGLLAVLADEAHAAGAELVFGVCATGLLWQRQRVVGIETSVGPLEAKVVVAAEGADRRLCEEAGLYGSRLLLARHMLVLSQELDAPAVGARNIGRFVTLGRRHTSAAQGFGALALTGPGRATMSFTLLQDEIGCASVDSAWRYLAQYARDPRIAGWLEEAHVVRRDAQLLPFGEAPDRVIGEGFIGTGDAITPAGHLGVGLAAQIGREAGLAAAAAVRGGPYAQSWRAYEGRCQNDLLPMLRAEAANLGALLEMTDRELDDLCCVLDELQVPLPFLACRHSPGWETVRAQTDRAPDARSQRQPAKLDAWVRAVWPASGAPDGSEHQAPQTAPESR